MTFTYRPKNRVDINGSCFRWR